MNAYDFVHLALRAMGGEIKGKTKLQKTIYFLGEIVGCLEDLGYRAHYYGPYSDTVAAATDRLVSLGFVDHSSAGVGSVDVMGFEVARHDFSLSEKGKRVADLKAKRFQDVWCKLENAAQVLQKAGDLDYMKLSIAAKTYFTLGQRRGTATFDDLARLARRFGWTVTGTQVREAADWLAEVGLVTLKADS